MQRPRQRCTFIHAPHTRSSPSLGLSLPASYTTSHKKEMLERQVIRGEQARGRLSLSKLRCSCNWPVYCIMNFATLFCPGHLLLSLSGGISGSLLGQLTLNGMKQMKKKSTEKNKTRPIAPSHNSLCDCRVGGPALLLRSTFNLQYTLAILIDHQLISLLRQKPNKAKGFLWGLNIDSFKFYFILCFGARD